MTSRRRISILTRSLGGGGIERVTLTLASAFLDRGHEVDLLTHDLVCDYPQDMPSGVRLFFLSHHGSYTENSESLEQLPVTPQPLTPYSFHFPRLAFAKVLSFDQLTLLKNTRRIQWALAIAAYIDHECPDALLAMSGRTVASATMAVRLASHKAQVVAVLHNVFKTGRAIRKAGKSFPYADAAVGVSLGVTAELAKVSGISPGRLHTIYNPIVSKNLLQKANETPDHPWCNEPGPPIVLAIGRLDKQKDFPTLLTAFARLLSQHSARLIVLGEGPLRPTLLALAHNLHISEYVDFPGFVSNPFAYLANAHLFVLSSRYEGLPTVLIEAMACGCPVVSTDCPFGPAEILENGRWGKLVPTEDPEALAKAMIHTMDTPPQRDTLRERASYFSVDRAVDRYEELLLV